MSGVFGLFFFACVSATIVGFVWQIFRELENK
jgi:hypothetical protein